MSDALRTWYLVAAAVWFTVGVRYLAMHPQGHSPARVVATMFAFGLVSCMNFERFRRGR